MDMMRDPRNTISWTDTNRAAIEEIADTAGLTVDDMLDGRKSVTTTWVEKGDLNKANFIEREIDRFFGWAAQTEKGVTYNPAFRFAYWESNMKYVEFMSPAEADKLLVVAE